MFGRALRSARVRAEKRGIEFNLDKQYIMDLYNEQDGKCYYSGVKMNIMKSNEDNFHDPMKMSLDCVDHSKGYIKGNVHWVSNKANVLKNENNFEDFEKIYFDMKKLREKNLI